MNQWQEEKVNYPEIWADVPGYTQYYEVSNYGRVKSKAALINHSGLFGEEGSYLKPIKVRALQKNRDGYLTVKLCQYGKCQRWLVHRLVARAFFPNKDFKRLTVNHISGIKTSNYIHNLELISLANNIKHAWETGLMTNEHMIGSSHYRSILKEDDIIQIKESKDTRRVLAEKYGVGIATINGIISGRSWKHVK